MRSILLSLLLLLSQASFARGVYLEPADFVNHAFSGQTPTPSVLWATGAIKERVSDILGHPPAALRYRYWANGARSAWVLEEIGKAEPITVGVVIEAGKIEKITVLEFRESRGDEVRHAFFTSQFIGATLAANDRLDRDIDGISGASLSVRALTKIAQLALFLDQSRKQP